MLDKGQELNIKFASDSLISFGDATIGLPVENNSVEVIYSSHMLEHLDREGAKSFLKEAQKSPSFWGIIRLVLPDLDKQVKKYLNSNDADEFISATGMTQPLPTTFVQWFKLMLVGPRNHQWMYDGASLSKLLIEQGVINTKILAPGETIIENPVGLLDLYERVAESVYVEAYNP